MVEKYYSWEIIDKEVAIKLTDKSVFDYNQTGIPIEVRSFWGVNKLARGEERKVRLYYKGRYYSAHIQMENSHRLRTKLMWTKALTQNIHSYVEYPYMRFEKKSNELYYVDFIYESNYDIPELDGNEMWYEMQSDCCDSRQEGRVIGYYSNKYERDKKNRKAAIKIHGLRCKVCDFDFQEKYGDLGQGFIEIHHKVPLYSLEEETLVNPYTDLVPVCSNCHRMIHRSMGITYSVEELKKIIKNNTNEEG